MRTVFTGGYALCLDAMLRTLGCARFDLGYEPDRFLLAESNLFEAHTIFAEVRGPDHKDTLECVRGLIDLSDSWQAAEPNKGYDAKAAEWRAKLEAAAPPPEPVAAPND